ncbi:MAG: tryptophan synthase subunit alpha [Ignavibacteriales bacterium]|nr:tryptophan synthase subunit alpha [Ignavibacteriales bacterium]
MLKIYKKIEEINNKKMKRYYRCFWTAVSGQENFVELALGVLDAGADMLEIGIPFSDPFIDGVVDTKSVFSQVETGNGVNLDSVFEFSRLIGERNDKPLILMGYANPALDMQTTILCDAGCGIDGLIIPIYPGRA